MTEGDSEVYEKESGIHFEGGSLTILFVIITLALGSCARELTKRIGFPYTPLLIIIGAVLGGAPVFGYITDSTDWVMKINPHAILIILLPILIFESSYNCHIEVLAKNFWQVIIIVGPGVLLQAIWLGVVIYYILDYQGVMSFSASLTLGSLLSTTDPVAVVALLKSLGAPLHIETLIEMESLFNDGVAMVFFNMFLEVAQGGTMSVGKAIGDFCSMAIGGPALGFAFAAVGIIILNVFTRGTTLFISLNVLMCYSVFLTGEKFLEGNVSGLLGIVGAGIAMNMWSKDYLTNSQKSSMSILLSYLQHISETVLFFLSGIFIGDNLFQESIGGGQFSDDDKITGNDWWKTIVLYLFLQIGRLMMFAIFWWPLTKIGEGFTFKEACLATWGGLRGALCIALALIIYADNSNPDGIDRKMQNLILFHTCCQATLTLLINGTTCGQLVEFIGIITNNQVKMKFKLNYLKEVKAEALKQEVLLQNTTYFDMVEWKGVQELVNLQELEKKQGWNDKNVYLHSLNYKSVGKKNLTQKQTILDSQKNDISAKLNTQGTERQSLRVQFRQDKITTKPKSEDSYQYIRYEFIRIFMRALAENKAKEWISGGVFALIYNAAEEVTEKLDHQIDIWHHLEESLASGTQLRILSKCSKSPIIGKVMNYLLHTRIEFIHEMVYIYLMTVNDTKAFIKNLQEHGQSRTVKNVQDWKVIMQEVDKDFYKAKSYLLSIRKGYYEVLAKLEQRKAAVKIIMAQAKMVDEHIENGYVPEKEGSEIKQYLSGKIAKLNSIRGLVTLTSQSQDQIQTFFRGTLEDVQTEYLISQSKAFHFEEKQEILNLQSIADFVYFISEGELEVTLYSEGGHQTKSMSFIKGQVVGLVNLVDIGQKSLVLLTAKEDTNVVALSITQLREYYFNNELFESFCLKKCFFQFLHLFSAPNGALIDDEDDQLWKEWEVKNIDEVQQIANESTVVRVQIGESIFLQHGGYLYQGTLYNKAQDLKYQDYQLLKPGFFYDASELCTLLYFNQSYSKMQVNDQKVEGQHGIEYVKNNRKYSQYMDQIDIQNVQQQQQQLIQQQLQNKAMLNESEHKIAQNEAKYLVQQDDNKDKASEKEHIIKRNLENKGDQDDLNESDGEKTVKNQSIVFSRKQSGVQNLNNLEPRYLGRRGSFESQRIQIMNARNREMEAGQSQVIIIKDPKNENNNNIKMTDEEEEEATQ